MNIKQTINKLQKALIQRGKDREMRKMAVIWCEVSCSNCGGVIGFDYKNAKTISALKRKVRDWKYCGEEGNLCPDCYKAWKNKK